MKARPHSSISKFIFAILVSGANALLGTDSPLPANASPHVPQPTPQLAAQQGSFLPDASGLTSGLAALVNWGPVVPHLHLSYNWVSADGLPVNGATADSTIQTYATGLELQIGRRSSLTYTATKMQYSQSALRNTLDHAATFATAFNIFDWQFDGSGSYGSQSPILFETARQTARKTYSFSINGQHQLGSRTYFDAAVNRDIRLAEEAFTTSREWSTTERIRLQPSESFVASIGLTSGYDAVTPGADIVFYRPQLGINWRPGERLTINVSGGIEKRNFQSGIAKDINMFIYSTTVAYKPFEHTSITLGSSRNSSVAFFANSISRNTEYNIIFEQRLLQHITFQARFVYDNAKYLVADVATLEHEDRSSSADFRLSTTILRRVSIAALYQHRRNKSNRSELSFDSNQYGGEISVHF
jgi:hypothetical protein